MNKKKINPHDNPGVKQKVNRHSTLACKYKLKLK